MSQSTSRIAGDLFRKEGARLGRGAEYGARLLPQLAEKLTEEFGRGFDERNPRNMRAFYTAFPIWNAVLTELNWTHYRTLIRVEDEQAREWYVNEAVAQNWSSRALERQVSRLYYERLLSSKDRKAVRAEAVEKIEELPPSSCDFVRDPVLLESDLEQRLIGHLQSFLLELIREQRLLEERDERRQGPA